MTLYSDNILSPGALAWGSCWSRPLIIGPTRLRSGLGFEARRVIGAWIL